MSGSVEPPRLVTNKDVQCQCLGTSNIFLTVAMQWQLGPPIWLLPLLHHRGNNYLPPPGVIRHLRPFVVNKQLCNTIKFVLLYYFVVHSIEIIFHRPLSLLINVIKTVFQTKFCITSRKVQFHFKYILWPLWKITSVLSVHSFEDQIQGGGGEL